MKLFFSFVMLYIIAVWLYHPTTLNAQTNTTTDADTTSGINRVWLYAGGGIGSGGLVAESTLTFAFGHKNAVNQKILVLRHSRTGIFLGSDGGSGIPRGEDVSILYGFAQCNPDTHLAVAAGLGYTMVGPPSTITLGFPFQAQAFLNARALGIGISVFGNVNFSQSFAGVALCLAIGKLW